MNIQVLVYDVETYPNYFMVGYSVATPIFNEKKEPYKFEYKRYYVDSKNMTKLRQFLERLYEIKDRLVMVGYNNTGFDKAIIEEAYRNRALTEDKLAPYLFNLGQEIIHNHTNLYRYNAIPQYDLMGIKTQYSLKVIGVLLHKNSIQELPYEPNTILNEEEIKKVIEYNQENDLSITEDILNLKFDDFITQYDVINEYNLPLNSFAMSKGGISELVLSDKTRKPARVLRTTYKCPYNIQFKSPLLQDILNEMENTTFVVGGDSYHRDFKWGDMDVSVGEGGIHGVIKQYYTTNVHDVDGTSYYPSLIITLNTLPTNEDNKVKYKQMKAERVILKKEGKKGKANARKLILNNVFGKTKFYTKNDEGEIKKLGSMFDFKAFMITTLTGQLLLLKLMEDLTEAGYKVIYLNTDGLSFEENGTNDWEQICKDWENLSHIDLEHTHIDKWWIKDVNNYVLIADDNGKKKNKIKGFYNTYPLSPTGFVNNSASRRICIDSVVKYLLEGKEIEDTINDSNDIRDFILHYKASSKYKDITLTNYIENEKNILKGKVFRWYKSKNNRNSLSCQNISQNTSFCPFGATNISLVYKLSDFPQIPQDLDKKWYIVEAYRIYKELTGTDVKGNKKVDNMLKELKERGIIE